MELRANSFHSKNEQGALMLLKGNYIPSICQIFGCDDCMFFKLTSTLVHLQAQITGQKKTVINTPPIFLFGRLFHLPVLFV